MSLKQEQGRREEAQAKVTPTFLTIHKIHFLNSTSNPFFRLHFKIFSTCVVPLSPLEWYLPPGFGEWKSPH